MLDILGTTLFVLITWSPVFIGITLICCMER